MHENGLMVEHQSAVSVPKDSIYTYNTILSKREDGKKNIEIKLGICKYQIYVQKIKKAPIFYIGIFVML